MKAGPWFSYRGPAGHDIPHDDDRSASGSVRAPPPPVTSGWPTGCCCPSGTVVVVATLPFVLAVIESVTRNGEFVGLANYVRALSNPLLADSVRQTAIYGLIVVPSEILLGMGLALFIHRTVRSAAVKAAIYVLAIIPIVIPGVAAGVIFRLIYAPEYGLLNFILEQLSPSGRSSGCRYRRWRCYPWPASTSGSGRPSSISSSSPRSRRCPTKRSRRPRWRPLMGEFRHIELPFIRPLVLLVLFFRIADVLRVFDHVFILTGGGPARRPNSSASTCTGSPSSSPISPQASALAVMVMVGMTLFYTLILRFTPLETD